MASTGGEIAAETIADLTDQAYGLSGGHIHPIWVRIPDTGTSINTLRDERAAIHAAHADAALTESVGVALVTTGPGFTNALTGVANAYRSGIPLLVIAGRPPIPQYDRGALESLPQRRMVTPITTTARTALEPERIREHLIEAAGMALDANAPAYVEVPTDVLRAETSTIYDRSPPDGPTFPDASDQDIDRTVEALETAEKPIVIAGRGACTSEGADAVRKLVEKVDLPILPTGGGRGILPTDHPLCIPGARSEALDTADAFLVLGKRIDFALAYGSPAVFPDTTFVQVDVDSESLRRNRTPDVPVLGTVSSTASKLMKRLNQEMADPSWVARLQKIHGEQAKNLEAKKHQDTSPIHPYRVCGAIEQAIDDAIVICDGGDTLSFGRISLPVADTNGYLDPGPFGCLGVGLPFAIGAANTCPDQDIICFTGDGAFGFNIMDIETAVRKNLDLTIIIADNSGFNIEGYGMEKYFGGAVGTRFSDVRFDQVAEGMGATGFIITEAKNIDSVIESAVSVDGPAVVDVKVDPEAKSPDAVNGLARVPKYQAIDYWDQKEQDWRAPSNPQ